MRVCLISFKVSQILKSAVFGEMLQLHSVFKILSKAYMLDICAQTSVCTLKSFYTQSIKNDKFLKQKFHIPYNQRAMI